MVMQDAPTELKQNLSMFLQTGNSSGVIMHSLCNLFKQCPRGDLFVENNKYINTSPSWGGLKKNTKTIN